MEPAPAPAGELAEGLDDRGPIRGQVADMIYLGSRTRVLIGIGSSATILAEVREHEIAGLEPGAAVSVAWDPDSATVWPTEQKETTAP